MTAAASGLARTARVVLAAHAAALLFACGGGGGDSAAPRATPLDATI